MKTQEDLRIVKTRRGIREAFYELAEQIGIEKITVQNLTEKAMINRSTFYLHYTDKYDLLRQLEEEIFIGMNKTLADVSGSAAPTDAGGGSPYPYVLNALIYVKDNQRIFKLLLSEKGDPTFAKRLGESIKMIAKERILNRRSKVHLMLSQRYLDALFISILTCFIGVWIDGGMDETAEDVAKMITTFLTEKPLSLVL